MRDWGTKYHSGSQVPVNVKSTPNFRAFGGGTKIYREDSGQPCKLKVRIKRADEPNAIDMRNVRYDVKIRISLFITTFKGVQSAPFSLNSPTWHLPAFVRAFWLIYLTEWFISCDNPPFIRSFLAYEDPGPVYFFIGKKVCQYGRATWGESGSAANTPLFRSHSGSCFQNLQRRVLPLLQYARECYEYLLYFMYLRTCIFAVYIFTIQPIKRPGDGLKIRKILISIGVTIFAFFNYEYGSNSASFARVMPSR